MTVAGASCWGTRYLRLGALEATMCAVTISGRQGLPAVLQAPVAQSLSDTSQDLGTRGSQTRVSRLPTRGCW